MPFILYRYLLSKALIRFGVLTALLMLLYAAIDYIETVSNSGVVDLYRVYGYRIPEILTYLLPLSLSAAILLTIADCRQKGEWHALQMAGMSTWRLHGALLLLPLLLLPVMWFGVHIWGPEATASFERAVHHRGLLPMTHYRQGNWMVSTSVDGAQLEVLRNSSGRARQLWMIESGTGNVIHHWESASVGETDRMVVAPGIKHRGDTPLMPQYSTNGIPGASVTTGALRAMMAALQLAGGNARALEATIAIRNSIFSATLLVPLVAAILFLFAAHLKTMFAAVSVAVGVSGAYWGILMLAWAWLTKVREGVPWIPGVAALCLLFCVGVVGVWVRKTS